MMAEQTPELPCQNDIQVTKATDDELDGSTNTIRPVLLLPTNENSLVPPDQVEDVDASPAVQEGDINGLVNAFIGQASTLTHRDSLHYDITGLKKVIIFNHKRFHSRFDLTERRGTEHDVKSIKKTFTSLKWEVQVCNDYTCKEIRDVMNNLQTSTETSQISALAVFILSHGEDNGTVFANDSMYRVDQDILYPLAADKCPLLAGKPKLIFVQACQGKSTDPGIDVRRRHTSQDSASTYRIPNFSDFLIFQASFWDHFSFRSSDSGSWFIQALCNKIDESFMDDSLLDTLLAVSRFISLEKESNVPSRPQLHQKKQTPLMYSTLLRRMYLKQISEPKECSRCSGCQKERVVPVTKMKNEQMDTRTVKNKENCICM